MKFFVALIMTLTTSLSWAASRASAEAKAQDAAEVFEFFMHDEAQAIPDSLLGKADCVMVITDMIRAGFIFGARTGWGVVSCRTSQGWSPAAFHQLTGVNWGFMAGIQKMDVVLVFTHHEAVRSLSSAKLNLGAGLGIAIGPLGRHAEVGTDYKLDSPVYSYARTKGLYAGVSLEGGVLDPKDSYNHLIYPRSSVHQILTAQNGTSVRTVEPFVRVLEKYARDDHR